MEEFFKQPALDRLYEALSVEFEESLLEDEEEHKKYHNILDNEENLQNELKEIVGQDEKKLKKLMNVIRELEKYCCEETDYWNKKYFKLGFTYMLRLQSQVNNSTEIVKKQKNNKEQISSLLHQFLNALRDNEVDPNQKLNFFNFIENLKIGTRLQKRRFCLYYNFDTDDNKLSYTEISKKERCTSEAVIYSINRFIQLLICMESEKDKNELLKLIQKNNILKNFK